MTEFLNQQEIRPEYMGFRWKIMSKITARSSVLLLLLLLFEIFSHQIGILSRGTGNLLARDIATRISYTTSYYRDVTTNQSKCYLDFIEWTYDKHFIFPSGPSRTKSCQEAHVIDL